MEFARLTKKNSTKVIDFDKVTGVTISNLNLALVRGIDSEVIERIDATIRDVLTPAVLSTFKDYTLTVRKEFNSGAVDISVTTLDALLARLNRARVVRKAINDALSKLPAFTDKVVTTHETTDKKSKSNAQNATGANALLALIDATPKKSNAKKDKANDANATQANATPAQA